MALATKFDGMLARGEVKDYADLARLGYVSRAHITQIMNLLTLAPDIQEALLSLPRTTTEGRGGLALVETLFSQAQGREEGPDRLELGAVQGYEERHLVVLAHAQQVDDLVAERSGLSFLTRQVYFRHHKSSISL